MDNHYLGRSRQPHEDVAARADGVATTSQVVGDTPTTERHRYTMTVEGVASLLHTHGLDRDSRTIQRWCKSGKIDAIIDNTNGERWLIDPATVQPVIDDIVASLERRPTAFTSAPISTSHAAATPVATSHDMDNSEPRLQGDERHDTAASSDDAATTSAADGDDVASLKKKVSDLEFENIQLKADVKSREQFNEYIKGEFESILEDTLDRAEEMGSLRKEVEVLRGLLPPGIVVPGAEELNNANIPDSTTQ